MEKRLEIEKLIEKGKLSNEDISELISGLSSNDIGIVDICKLALCNLKEERAISASKELVKLIESEDIVLRGFASEILINYSSYSIEALLPYLKSNNLETVKYTIDLLGLLGNESAFPPLISLLNSPDINIVASVIEAIGNLNSKEAVSDIISLFSNSKDLQPVIIETMGKLGGEKAEQFLIKIIDNEDLFLRVLAIDAIGICSENIEISKTLLKNINNYPEELQLILLKSIFAISYRCNYDLDLPLKNRIIAYKAIDNVDDDIKMSGLAALGNEFENEDIQHLIKLICLNKSEIQQWILFNLVNYNTSKIRHFFDTYFSEPREYMIEFISNILLILHDLGESESRLLKSDIVKIINERDIDSKSTVIDLLN